MAVADGALSGGEPVDQDLLRGWASGAERRTSPSRPCFTMGATLNSGSTRG